MSAVVYLLLFGIVHFEKQQNIRLLVEIRQHRLTRIGRQQFQEYGPGVLVLRRIYDGLVRFRFQIQHAGPHRLIGSLAERPRPYLFGRILESVGEHVHHLADQRHLFDLEDAEEGPFGIVQVVTLVAVEAVFEEDVDGHVEVGLVALLPPHLFHAFLFGQTVGELAGYVRIGNLKRMRRQISSSLVKSSLTIESTERKPREATLTKTKESERNGSHSKDNRD